MFMAVVWLGQVSEVEMPEGHSRISLVIILIHFSEWKWGGFTVLVSRMAS
jgi:hypothetical protein